MTGDDRAGDTSCDPARILYWYDTTRRQPYETGIQRVTRRLARALAAGGAEIVPAMFDPHRRDIALATPRRRASASLDDPNGWLLVVEVPTCLVRLDLDPVQLARAYGLRTAALVHDLIPMKLVEHYDEGTRALFVRYYRMFADADLVFATTEWVAADLRAHLAALGLRLPEIAIVPLAAQFADMPRRAIPPPPRAAEAPLALLTVGTMEPRKNLPGLLRAIEAATVRGAAVRLTIAGKRSIHHAYEAEVDALVARTPGVSLVEMPDDAALAALYAGSHAGIYCSCEEGFGLPVVESLWLGRPCICHDGSAMAEVAPGGGTLMIDMADEDAIADALVALAAHPGILARLAAEAVARPLRGWADVARDVVGHLGRMAAR